MQDEEKAEHDDYTRQSSVGACAALFHETPYYIVGIFTVSFRCISLSSLKWSLYQGISLC